MQSQTREIQGHVFSVSQLPAMRGFKLLHRITKAIGPALARAAGAVGGKGLDGMQVGELAPAIEALFANLTEAEFEAIVKDLLSTAHVHVADSRLPLFNPSGTGHQFDTVFMGKPDAVFAVLAFAFEVNYGSFFERAKGAFATRPAPTTGSPPA